MSNMHNALYEEQRKAMSNVQYTVFLASQDFSLLTNSCA